MLQLALGAILVLALASHGAAAPGITHIDPPESGFYARQLDYRGIPIKAHESVADEALFVARDRLDAMLRHLDAAVANLRLAGIELHIIGKDQVTSDLPEHRHMKGKPFDGKLTVDERTRGLGGQLVSCGEENLLGLHGDRYAGRDICLHEFAHALFTYGLSDDVRRRVADQRRRSLEKGRWKGAYAGTNDDEFFAELAMWYFGTHGDLGMEGAKPGIGREALRRYDPEAFTLLDDLYAGRIPVQRIEPAELPALPPENEAELRSSDGATTAIHFHNRTPHKIQVFWIDNDGKRRTYATIAPGGRWAQATFAGHVWLVTDTEGKGLAIFVAGPKAGLAVVGEPKPAETRREAQ